MTDLQPDGECLTGSVNETFNTNAICSPPIGQDVRECPVSLAPKDSSAEDRIERRQRTMLGGELIFDDGRGNLDCQIRNISKSGARLDLFSTADIPDRFVLEINNGGGRRPVTVAWRSATSMGVAFDIGEDEA